MRHKLLTTCILCLSSFLLFTPNAFAESVSTGEYFSAEEVLDMFDVMDMTTGENGAPDASMTLECCFPDGTSVALAKGYVSGNVTSVTNTRRQLKGDCALAGGEPCKKKKDKDA